MEGTVQRVRRLVNKGQAIYLSDKNNIKRYIAQTDECS